MFYTCIWKAVRTHQCVALSVALSFNYIFMLRHINKCSMQMPSETTRKGPSEAQLSYRNINRSCKDVKEILLRTLGSHRVWVSCFHLHKNGKENTFFNGRKKPSVYQPHTNAHTVVVRQWVSGGAEFLSHKTRALVRIRFWKF